MKILRGDNCYVHKMRLAVSRGTSVREAAGQKLSKLDRSLAGLHVEWRTSITLGQFNLISGRADFVQLYFYHPLRRH